MKNLPRRDEALLSVPLTVHALIPGTPEKKWGRYSDYLHEYKIIYFP